MASLTWLLIRVLSSIAQFFNHYIFNQTALQLNSTAMDLNAFPDVVLRAVFDRVPLLDLVRHIPLVCHRWHSLQSSVLSNKKISLTLFVGPEAQSLVEESYVTIPFSDELTNEDGSPMYPKIGDPKFALTLTLTTLTSAQVDLIVEKLKNVTFMELSIRQTPEVTVAIPLVIRLLEHLARSLKTLKLRCRFTDGFELDQRVETSDVLARLIKTINKLPLLEHLTLDLNEKLQLAKPLNLPILGRLKEFYFNSGDQSTNLLASLKRYGEPNKQLRAIGLGNSAGFDEFMGKFAESPLRKRFTMLIDIGSAGEGRPFMTARERQRFTSTFTEQTNYSIGMAGLNLARLTAILAPLHNLVYLEICSGESFSLFDDTPVDQIRPLPSVKVLDFNYRANFQNSTHKELGSKYWGRLFPNLQIIKMVHATIACRICDYNEFGVVREPEKVAPCVQRALLQFKQQFRRTLKKVYYCRNYDEANIKVFTPETI